MVMGIFLACLLVGLLYYLAGLGQAILFRERMQDAADSAALAGAVLAARGMNVIALLNTYMAATLVVILSLSLAQDFVNAAAVPTAFGECAAANLKAAISSTPANILDAIRKCLNIATVTGTTLAVNNHVNSKLGLLTGQVNQAGAAAEGLSLTLGDAVSNKVRQMGAQQFRPTTLDACLARPFTSLPVERKPSSQPCDAVDDKAYRPYLPHEGRVNPFIPDTVIDPLRDSAGINQSDLLPGMVPIYIKLKAGKIGDPACDNLRVTRKGVDLGTDAFQIRVAVDGNPPFRGPFEGAKVALWGGDPERAGARRLRRAGQVAVAQAEFFYELQEPSKNVTSRNERDDWLWNMHWTARLRRFSLNGNDLDAPCVRDRGELTTYDIDNTVVH
jgi:hypothetical protein